MSVASTAPLGPGALRNAAEAVAEAAQAADVAVALCGGFAMQQYGSPRLTSGVDVVAERTFTPFDDGEPLPFGGVRVVVDAVATDIIVRSDKYRDLYAEALRHARPVDGLAMPVVEPEFLTAMKMAARRHIDELDLRFLVESEALDLDRARRVIERHLGPFAVDAFDDLVVDVRLDDQRKSMRRGLGSE